MNIQKSENNIKLGVEYKLLFGDTPLTLDKGFMSEGGRLPSMTGLVAPDLSNAEVNNDIRKTIFTVPSLDTPVCEWQIKHLSNSLSDNVDNNMLFFVVSVDTPFAQARFIKDNNINPKIRFLSDYSEHSFMEQSGLRIIELNLFARAIIECDDNNIVQRVTIPRDITHVP
ncbi:redoxin family protein [Citrobacter meridianamericanus]|uniref:redoxin family protein n=1 Tax=Citrobacter meridianamericanus TaxID=2894201 RepID=UPI00351CF1C5